MATFLAVERRSDEPMLPLELFRLRLFSVTALVTFLLGFVLISVPFFTAQYFQDVRGASPLGSGLRERKWGYYPEDELAFSFARAHAFGTGRHEIKFREIDVCDGGTPKKMIVLASETY